MILDIPQRSQHVWISAFRSRHSSVEEILRIIRTQINDVCVQLVDLNKVAGSRYLFLATNNAFESFHSKQPISRTLGMEMLLYASADRQISEAIRRVGISSNTQEIAVIAVAPKTETLAAVKCLLEKQFSTESDDRLVDTWSKERLDTVRKNFGITPKELSATLRRGEDPQGAIERLAIERSALLSVRR